jgi:RNA polymerase sigma factor (sigma-70 family)
VTESQQAWVYQAQKGNELAAYNLYQDFSKAMYNTLMRMVRDEEAAKDLLQEGFIRAFNHLGSLQNTAAFGGWLKTIMINLALEYMRKQKFIFEEIDDRLNIQDDDNTLPDMDPAHIHEAIKELPNGYRMVFTLHLLEGYKHEDVAKALGISVSTSKSQYHHARHLLRKKLVHAYENGY